MAPKYILNTSLNKRGVNLERNGSFLKLEEMYKYR